MEERILLKHDIAPPALPDALIVRQRLNELYTHLYEKHQHVVVLAPAGSGKTVQAQLFAAQSKLPLAWLTLRKADVSASRLLPLLAACLEEFSPNGRRAVSSALAAGLTAEEVAAVLAENLADGELILVIDQCEAIVASEEALGCLATFLEYAPESAKVMLLSREHLPGLMRVRLFEQTIGLVTEDSLRLTLTEAQELVAGTGGDQSHVSALHESTKGWMAGVAFGSRRANSSRRAVELSSYLRDEVLDTVPPDERDFLLATSILEVVTADSAVALLGQGGRRLWEVMRTRRLPATTVSDDAIQYHSLMRNFLHDELVRRSAERESVLVNRYAAYLSNNRHFEEATELHLSLGDLDTAASTAESAVTELYQRADWTTIDRWLTELGSERIDTRPRLVAARIRSLYGTRQFAEVQGLIRRLDHLGHLRAAVDADPGVVATAGWALQAEPAEARRLLDRYVGDYRAEAIRFLLDTTTELAPATPPQPAVWGEFERLVTWAYLLQGRLTDASRSDADANRKGETPLTNPNTLLAIAWRGDADEAQTLWEQFPQEIRIRPHSLFIEAGLLLAAGNGEAALASVEAAVADSRTTGFPLDQFYEVFRGYVLLTLGHVEDSLALFESRIGGLTPPGHLATLEWAQAFLGCAYLLDGRVEDAQYVLQECVSSMTQSKRRLLLPFAAICLSEVYARFKNDAASHELASLAYHTSSLTESFFWLLQALAQFPGVREREIAFDPSDSRWRRIAPTPSAQAASGRLSTTGRPIVAVDLQPFGQDAGLFVDGGRTEIARLRVIELAAYLCLHPDGVDRTILQQALFPDSDQRRGGNHFRQIAHKLREATGISLDRVEPNLVRWPTWVSADSADLRFERQVAAASAAVGRTRMGRLAGAIELFTGPYLQRSDLFWAEERRYHLDVVREEALLELVQLCLDLGELEMARIHGETLLQIDPYSQECYRVLIQVERLIGTDSSCLAVFRRAVNAQRELGLEPDAETARLARSITPLV